MNDSISDITIYNPLPLAMKHYTRELKETLEDAGFRVRVREQHTEGKRGFDRLRAFLLHIRATRQVAGSGPVVVVWPLLGWYELVLLARRRSSDDVHLVVHDPEPLRPQLGLSARAAKLSRTVSGKSRPRVFVHSTAARTVTEALLGQDRIVQVPHPALSPNQTRTPSSMPPRVSVIGQYKPARDLDLLSQLSARSTYRDMWLIGRGWPSVAGWNLREEFLSEADLDAEIAKSDVIVIPYVKYFQSGIAVRALEQLTPIVGLRSPFLEDLLGTDYPGFVESQSTPDSWLDAIGRALDYDMSGVAKHYVSRSGSAWHAAIRTATEGRTRK